MSNPINTYKQRNGFSKQVNFNIQKNHFKIEIIINRSFSVVDISHGHCLAYQFYGSPQELTESKEMKISEIVLKP